MRRTWIQSLVVMAVLATIMLSTGCVATRKFTRNEVQTSVKASEDRLSSRIDATDRNVSTLETNAKEMNDHLTSVDRATKDNAQQIAGVKTDVQRVDGKAGEAASAAARAQGAATQVSSELAALDERFKSRNNYQESMEKQVFFKFNSSSLGEDFLPVLDEIARAVKANPDAFVVLEGRTDAIGAPSYNIQLGQKRVDAVMRYLIVDQSVPMHRVFQMSFGEEKPMASNDSKDGREQNRSVVVRIFTPRGAAVATSSSR